MTRGTSTLLLGSVGTDKTLLALQFALVGGRDGERVVYLGFRETLPQLLAKADAFALGAELRAGLAAPGTLILIRWEPVELLPDQVPDHLLGVFNQTGARRLIIDSVAELQRAVQDTSSAGRVANVLAELHAILGSIGEVLFTNATYATLFGVRRLAGTAEDEHGVALAPEELPQHLATRGQPFRMTFTLPTSGGERRYYEATGAPIWVGKARQGSVITLRDITDRSLRCLQEEWLALAGHELRSPLTALKSAAQLLDRRIAPTDEHLRPLLPSILRQIARLQRLIKDLMDVSRFHHGKLRLIRVPVDLGELIPSTSAAFALGVPPPDYGGGPPPGTLIIQGDALRLEQILTNLLTNASKYAADSPQIVVRVAQVGPDAEIQVRDQGPGIAAADLPHLFQRFYQVQADARSGLGLGLFLTRELVVAQGGQIALSSQVGQGTTFTLRFPLHRAHEG